MGDGLACVCRGVTMGLGSGLRWVVTALLGLAVPAGAAAEGDRLDGTPVIERLDAQALSLGKVHRFWFRVTDNAVAQPWLVPVVVIRGARPGPRLLLTAGIHGDELNGIDVIHQLTAALDPQALSGTVVAVPGLNIPGLLHHTRGFTPGDGSVSENLNRLMPGMDGSAPAADRYAKSLWTGLLRPNADTVIDLHTQSRGTAYPMYAFASTPRARQIAELVGPDIIKLDPGAKGTLETEMTRSGVPAITLELGRPEMFDPVMVGRAVAGIKRVMADMQMLVVAPPRTVQPFVGNKLVVVHGTRGGFTHVLTPLGTDVRKGDPVATISDAFGRVIETIVAPESGRVNTISTDPLHDPGDMVVRILFTSPDPACAMGC